MKKNLIILVLGILLVLAIWRPDFHRLFGNSVGEPYLPPPPAVMNEAGLMAALIGISISPVDAPRIGAIDRMPFLLYVQQLCAVAEIPSVEPFYLSANADVWRIMKANFKESAPWFDDPAIVQGKMVDVKAIAPKVLRLVP